MGRIKKGEDWPELTEENFKIGEANGINRRNVRQRYVNYGWTIERAITDPINVVENSKWKPWKETALQNGVYLELFHARLKLGYTEEQAATTPNGAKINGQLER